jgi:hypothetical protein
MSTIIVLVLMVQMELVCETLVKCIHLTCLSAQENVFYFSHCESLRTYEELTYLVTCLLIYLLTNSLSHSMEQSRS